MRLIKIILGLAVFFLALPGAAEEIVYFKTGQTLPIRSHVITEGMVRVDLGANSMMAFPEFTIDRIEVAGENVLLKRSFGVASNQRVPTTQGTFPVQGTQRPQDRKEIPTNHSQATPVKTDPKTGLAGYFPQGHSPAPNRRQFQVTGNMHVFGQNPTRQGKGETYTGTTQVGNRHVIGNIGIRRSRNPNTPQIVGVTQKDSGSLPPPANRDTAAPPPDGSDNN